jgi:hypothetical protein
MSTMPLARVNSHPGDDDRAGREPDDDGGRGAVGSTPPRTTMVWPSMGARCRAVDGHRAEVERADPAITVLRSRRSMRRRSGVLVTRPEPPVGDAGRTATSYVAVSSSGGPIPDDGGGGGRG